MKILKNFNVLETVKEIYYDQDPKSAQFSPAYSYGLSFQAILGGSLWHSFSDNTYHT